MTLALGIDIGTSGVRTAVVQGDGTPISFAAKAHKHQPDPNAINARLWWDAVEECLQEQITTLRRDGVDPAQIKHLAVDGTSGTMVLVNADHEPVTPALMYNSGGFEDEAAVIARFAPDQHITQGANSALCRALRLQALDQNRGGQHLLHQADYIAAKLAGHIVPSDDNNALKTGYDPEAGVWPDWIGNTGLNIDFLPQVARPGSDVAAISADVAAALGLSPKLHIHAGTTDSIAAYLACATPTPGVAVTSIGTTLAIKVMSPTRIDDPASGLYSHRLGDGWLVGGASNTGGGVLRHFFSVDDLERLSQDIDPNTPSPLDYYPLLKPGERFPINDPKLEPRLSPRPDNDVSFLYGLLEGIARIEGLCYAKIVEAGGTALHQIFTAGGAAKNQTLTQIRSRHLMLEPTIAQYSDAAIGAAKLSMLQI